MKILKRKTGSDKFLLTHHPTGQYCKKIKGKIYYFGSNKKQALKRYLYQATYLHGCQSNLQQKATGDNITRKQLCDMYLKYQSSKVQVKGPTAKHHNDLRVAENQNPFSYLTKTSISNDSLSLTEHSMNSLRC